MPSTQLPPGINNWFTLAERLYGNQRFAFQLMAANPGISMLTPGINFNAPNFDTSTQPVVGFEGFAIAAAQTQKFAPGIFDTQFELFAQQLAGATNVSAQNKANIFGFLEGEGVPLGDISGVGGLPTGVDTATAPLAPSPRLSLGADVDLGAVGLGQAPIDPLTTGLTGAPGAGGGGAFSQAALGATPPNRFATALLGGERPRVAAAIRPSNLAEILSFGDLGALVGVTPEGVERSLTGTGSLLGDDSRLFTSELLAAGQARGFEAAAAEQRAQDTTFLDALGPLTNEARAEFTEAASGLGIPPDVLRSLSSTMPIVVVTRSLNELMDSGASPEQAVSEMIRMEASQAAEQRPAIIPSASAEENNLTDAELVAEGYGVETSPNGSQLWVQGGGEIPDVEEPGAGLGLPPPDPNFAPQFLTQRQAGVSIQSFRRGNARPLKGQNVFSGLFPTRFSWIIGLN